MAIKAKRPRREKNAFKQKAQRRVSLATAMVLVQRPMGFLTRLGAVTSNLAIATFGKGLVLDRNPFAICAQTPDIIKTASNSRLIFRGGGRGTHQIQCRHSIEITNVHIGLVHQEHAQTHIFAATLPCI
jgi:hypothetical protein